MPPLTPARITSTGSAVASATNVANPTTLIPPAGTGYAIGDMLLCFTACRSATPTVATPSGWTSLLNITGTNGRLALFGKVATSTAEADPSVVWSGLTTGNSGTPCAAVVGAFRNLGPLASLADVVGTIANGAASTATSAGGSALSTVADNDLVLALTTRLDDAFTTFTAPAGFTNVTPAFGSASGSDFALSWAYQVKTPAGSVTAPNFGLTGATSFASSGVMVALKAAVPVVNSDTPSGTINLSGSVVESSLVPYSQMILATSGLVSYWRLGEGSGSALDSKGSNHGTVVGGITRNVSGLLAGDANGAMQGDGVLGSYITIPTNASLDATSQATVEMWVRPTVIPVGKSPYVISRNADQPFAIRHYGSGDGRWEFNFYDTGSLRHSTSPSSPVAAAGTRHHLVMTYDAAGQMRCYINGAQVALGSPVPGGVNLKSGGAIVIFDRTATNNANFSGVIDDIAFYNVALTPAQILEHYTNGTTARPVAYTDAPSGTIALSGSVVESYSGPTVYTDARSGTIVLSGSCVDALLIPMVPYSDLILGTAGLVSYWRLGEASGNALDSKDSNPGTTVAGGITRAATGLLASDSDGAMQGNGVVGSYVNVPSNVNMNVGAQLTLECWVKPTSVATCKFIARSSSSTCFWLEIISAARYRWYVRDTAQVDTLIQVTTPVAVIGTRHHLVGVYDAAGTMKLYINGVAVPDAPNRTPNANVRTATQALNFFAESVSAASFGGTIDEVALYNTVLTAQQVLEHYNNGSTARPTVYTDTCSGTISLSGSVVESWSRAGVDAPSGTIVLAGTVIASMVFADARSGTVSLAGSIVEVYSAAAANPIMMVV